MRYFLLVFLFCVVSGLAAASESFQIDYKGHSYDVHRLDKGEEQRLRLFWKKPDKTPYGTIFSLLSEMSKQGTPLEFATNGAIFSKQFTPLGLYIENGKRYYKLNKVKGGGNFFLRPNGVFYVTSKGARIVETNQYKPKRKVKQAIQAGPMLVINNKLHPKFTKNKQSYYIRSGVGIDHKGRVVFVISNDIINLYDFADMFKNKLKAPNALYLDGNISEMYAPDINRNGGWGFTQFTSIIGVYKQ